MGFFSTLFLARIFAMRCRFCLPTTLLRSWLRNLSPERVFEVPIGENVQGQAATLMLEK